MKSNGDEQNDKLVPNRNAERHTDEDAVEQNADLEHHALKHVLLVLLLRRELEMPAGETVLLVDDHRLVAKPFTGLPIGGWRPDARVLVIGPSEVGELSAQRVGVATCRPHLQ